MPFAAALSRHPDTATAIGEVIGEVMERVGSSPNLAVLFAGATHLPALEAAAATVQTLLDPSAFIGCSASGVLAGAEGIEHGHCLSLWAGTWPGGADLTPTHLRALPVGAGAGPAGSGWTFEGFGRANAATMIVLADPFTFPVDAFFDALRRSPDRSGAPTQVIGGLASAGRAAGDNRLVIGGRVVRQGAVAIELPPDAVSRIVVSQGCRPIGRPFTVTRSERNFLLELAGRPALTQVNELLEGLDPDERRLAALGLHCGIVVNESKLDFDRGDFLVRGVLGADRAHGAVAVGDFVEVGTTVQFQVRDATTAGEDLEALLGESDEGAALLFTCNGRGASMFGDPSHDPRIVSERLGPAVAGLFCAGELGPIGGRNALHGFTASLALFAD